MLTSKNTATTRPPVFSSKREKSFFSAFRLHPLFLIVGIWYLCKGELFLFLLSALVAVQHECAHAFAASKLGYALNQIVLMPFGAVIDGDLKGISFKDEFFVALYGPLCNLCTAGFFLALWWIAPTTYAFTDTAYYSSLSIALVNLIPAYPLDGGRVLKCALIHAFLKSSPEEHIAEKKAEKICKIVTFSFAFVLLLAFVIQLVQKQPNVTLLAFALFLIFGGIGNENKSVYDKIDFSNKRALQRGVEIRRIAVLSTLPIKDALRFVAKGYYLVLEVYDEQENYLCHITQNELSDLFARAPSPYAPILEIKKR